MAKDVWYKGVRVSKGSDLYAALEKSKNDPVQKNVATGIFCVVEADFKQRYPQCTPEWFAKMNSHDYN
ncbi:hypothetical protein D3C87_279100 [compost metagenome]